MQDGIREQTTRQPLRCPYCHESVSQEEDLVACISCSAEHHRSCHTAHGACATCGAVESLAREVDLPQAPPGVIRVSRGAEGEVAYSWPCVTARNARRLWVLSVCLTPLLVGFWFLYKLHALRSSRREAGFLLGPDRFVLTGYPVGVLGHEVQWETAREGGFDLLISRRGSTHSLTAQLPGLSALVASSHPDHSLEPEEVEWLHEQLKAWKAGRIYSTPSPAKPPA